MAEDLLINRVVSQTVGIPGRTLNSARTNHFVIDEPAYYGAGGEALGPAEAFLSGVSSCGVLLVESQARQNNIPLTKATATIEGIRNRSDTSTFTGINIRFDLTGVNQQQAEQLVDYYTSH